MIFVFGMYIIGYIEEIVLFIEEMVLVSVYEFILVCKYYRVFL